jgi:hypothetical protein
VSFRALTGVTFGLDDDFLRVSAVAIVTVTLSIAVSPHHQMQGDGGGGRHRFSILELSFYGQEVKVTAATRSTNDQIWTLDSEGCCKCGTCVRMQRSIDGTYLPVDNE